MTTTIDIRFGGYQPPASVHTRAAEVFGRALTSRLRQAVRFRLDGNILTSGHKAIDLLRLIEGGTLTMGYFSASYLAERVPECALLDLPFLLTERGRAHAVLDGACGQLLADRLRATTGFEMLGFWDNGFRHISNAIRPIHTPADCQGLRIRTQASAMHGEVFKLLGFEPVVLDVGELVAGVRSGTVAAQENPLTTFYHFGLHTYHRHLTLTGHFFGTAVLLCHRASYAAWPGEVRRAVQEAAAEATAAQRRFAAAADDDVLGRLPPTEYHIVRLTDAERALFVEAVQPLLERQRHIFGDRLFGYLTS